MTSVEPDTFTTESGDDRATLARRHREILFPSVGLCYDVPIEPRRGERQFVYDGAGRQYLDFFGGIATVSSGHAIPAINDAIKAQLDRITHTSTLSPLQVRFVGNAADFGFQAYGVEPDVVVFAKGLANGIPIGGLIATDELATSIRPLSLSTFSGNPIATTAALANLNYIATHNLKANAPRVGTYLIERLWELARRHPVIGDVRGIGC